MIQNPYIIKLYSIIKRNGAIPMFQHLLKIDNLKKMCENTPPCLYGSTLFTSSTDHNICDQWYDFLDKIMKERFIQFLNTMGAYDKFKKAYLNPCNRWGKNQTFENYLTNTSWADLLQYSFSWSETEDGYDYWDSIYLLWMESYETERIDIFNNPLNYDDY